jgi:hypothetical protein
MPGEQRMPAIQPSPGPVHGDHILLIDVLKLSVRCGSGWLNVNVEGHFNKPHKGKLPAQKIGSFGGRGIKYPVQLFSFQVYWWQLIRSVRLRNPPNGAENQFINTY